MTQDGDQSPGGGTLWLESRASGLQSSWGSWSLTSRTLSTTEEDVLFSMPTASVRLTSVSSIPFTFNKMSPEAREAEASSVSANGFCSTCERAESDGACGPGEERCVSLQLRAT